MKDNKNDSTPALNRFGRDRRQVEQAPRGDRRPRLQREAADGGNSHHESNRDSRGFNRDDKPFGDKPRRSFNPNFDKEGRSFGDRKPFGERSERKPDTRKPFEKAFGGGEKKEYRDRKPFEERKFGDKPTFGDRKPYGDKPAFGDRKPYGERKFGDKPAFGDRKPFGERKFGDKPAFGDRKPYGDKPFKKKFDGPRPYPKFDAAKQTGEVRLNRFLAQSGVGSRREADELITAGLVTVNGQIVTTLGTKVLPTDEVKFNDSKVEGEKKVYLVLNKPKGFVTSVEDEHAAKTVMELVKDACTERVYPVGRLDKNTLGLLLFTNDGDLTRQLTHPSFQKKKIYQATLDKPLTQAHMQQLAEGVVLEDGEAHADQIAYVKDKRQEIGIEIHSGRNRIVRRMFEYLGYNVAKLDRVYYAGLTKKNLKRGQWRFLTREEVQRLKAGLYE